MFAASPLTVPALWRQLDEAQAALEDVLQREALPPSLVRVDCVCVAVLHAQ